MVKAWQSFHEFSDMVPYNGTSNIREPGNLIADSTCIGVYLDSKMWNLSTNTV